MYSKLQVYRALDVMVVEEAQRLKGRHRPSCVFRKPFIVGALQEEEVDADQDNAEKDAQEAITSRELPPLKLQCKCNTIRRLGAMWR